MATDLLDLPIARLDGTATTLGELTGGKPALLVNVASKCGLTPQYAGLEQLQETYAERGFTVVGLPCNQFMGQEPGSAEEIQEFCSATSRARPATCSGTSRSSSWPRTAPCSRASARGSSRRTR
jgi:glutathione peroxidase-family protein